MALFQYMRRVQRILRDQRVQIINPTDITDYINEARNQISGEGECIRYMASLTLTASTQVYPFSSFTLTGATGIQGVMNVRTIWYSLSSTPTGRQWITPRPFEWFSIYDYNTPTAPTNGPPVTWAQFAQGINGSIYLSPPPDQAYVLAADCVCYPISLVNDTTAEAIPPLWTDAIAYYAAYLVLLSMETGGSTEEADKMFQRYEVFMARARKASTPSVLPVNYPQNPMPQPSQGTATGNAVNTNAPT